MSIKMKNCKIFYKTQTASLTASLEKKFSCGETCFWKIFKVRKAFGCVAGAYYFQYQVSWGSSNEWGVLSEIVL